MTSITEAIRHYQRSIERFAEDESRLLHCLAKLNKLPINVKYLQETKVGRTVNDLRKCNGKVGHAATALIAKWKRKTEVENERIRPKDTDTENIEPCALWLNNYTDSQKIGINTTSNSDSESNKGRHLEKSEEKSISRLKWTSSKNCDEKRSTKSNRSNRSTGESKRGNDNIASSDHSGKRERTNRRERGKTRDKSRPKHDSDLIEIDCTMGTSFAEALGMLDMPTTSTKANKLHNDKRSTCNVSASSERRKSGKSSVNETPILLTKRPTLKPPLNIADELLTPPSTFPYPETTTHASSTQQPSRKQTHSQMNDEAMIVSCSIKSRTAITKVFSGNKTTSKCKVPTLFEMSIRILEDNIDLLEFTGGVPFDILRPVLKRATHAQLMTLEDYNPYLMEDTSDLWEQHCKRRFRGKHREEMETWREMYIRCLDEEHTKFNSLTATIKLSKKCLTKSTYVDTTRLPNTKTNQMKRHAGRDAGCVVGVSTLQNATKSTDPIKNRKRSKKSNEDPDWTPTTWYRTLYKKVPEPKPPKPPKPPIKKTIDMLRYDRIKALEKKKEERKRKR